MHRHGGKRRGGGGGGLGSGGLWVWRISPLTQRQHCGVLSTSHLLCSVADGFTPVQCFLDAVPSVPVKVTPKSDSLKKKTRAIAEFGKMGGKLNGSPKCGTGRNAENYISYNEKNISRALSAHSTRSRPGFPRQSSVTA